MKLSSETFISDMQPRVLKEHVFDYEEKPLQIALLQISAHESTNTGNVYRNISSSFLRGEFCPLRPEYMNSVVSETNELKPLREPYG